MSNSGASSSRVSIPNNVRKTIQNIKEITGNHSDEDIYQMLKDCSMDPNETTQRLLLLDTFHEVKSKRDKRKENVRSRSGEESRGRPGYQGRGPRGARGNSYSQYSSNDAGGRRNAAFWKENGVGERRERGFRPSAVPVSKGADPIQSFHVEKSSSITMNGPAKLTNGTLSGWHDDQSSIAGDGYVSKENIDASVDNSSSKPNADAELAPSASDPVLLPSRDSRLPTAVGAIKCEVMIQQSSAEPADPIPTQRGLGTTESMSNSHQDTNEPQSANGSKVSSSMIDKETFGHINVAESKVTGVSPAADKLPSSDSGSVVKPSSSQGLREITSKLEKLKFSDGQHVIIPNHIQVPDAVKNVLSFGSLDASFGVRENCITRETTENSNPAADTAHDENPSKTLSCDQDTVSTVPEGKLEGQPQSPSSAPGNDSPLENNNTSSATVPKDDQLKEETLPAVGPPFPVVQTTPSYSFGFMPPMLVNPIVQPEGLDSQAQLSNSLSGSSSAIPNSASTPPLPQPAGGQSSVALSPQPIALFRQPYPPNYIPYNHYLSSYYVPQAMHQYFGHTAFPTPLPAGNVYLPPPAAVAGMKIPPAPYKMGSNMGNQAPVGVPSGYGSYSSSQVGLSPNASVTSGNSSTSEDLVPSVLKENNIYSGQQSEGTAVWLPAPGRDTATFPMNSFMNLPPQGQHMITPQSGPGAFVYHALQPMATPAPGFTLMQQSQSMAGPVDSVGPPSNAYQQPQRQQAINWNM